MENNNKEITTLSDESMEVETKNEEINWNMQRKHECCIYKVPEFIRKEKEECYRPSVVSIGPIYYQDPQLETMQEVKQILYLLESFLQHPENACPRWNDYVEAVRRWNKDIRDCYQEKKMLSRDDEFVEMIVLDAVFLITILMASTSTQTSVNPFMSRGPLPRKVSALLHFIRRDLIVEENQLPFFVLKDIFCKACPTEPISTLIDGACEYIICFDRFHNHLADLRNSTSDNVTDFKHLLDLWWKCCCSPFERHLKELLSVSEDDRPNIEDQPIINPRKYALTAKQLFAAGVKFKINDNSRNSFDIKFDKLTGELQIPKLELHNLFETYFRNILFFEQCHYSYAFGTCIIDFLTFLDALIDTEEDIKVLQQHGILIQLNGNEQQAADFFNHIGKSIGYAPGFFNYFSLTKQLHAYANQPWNRWLAILRRDYFNHPWAIVSFIFAIILFILTLLQTITSFTKN